MLALITKEPVGVVGAVLPWNWPMGLLGWKIPPALAAGNSVVLKPDEQTSLSALRFAALAQEAGLPEGVFNVVTGGPAVGEAIGRHADIDVVGFTGSTEVGKLFMKYSSESNMKPVWTECGGKGPNIVFADAPDLAVAAQTAAFAIFLNTGQVCAAAGRGSSSRNRPATRCSRSSRAWASSSLPADPLEAQTMLGPMAKASQLDRVLGYIDTGRKEGAKLVTGGKPCARSRAAVTIVEPTVFDGVRNDMRIAQEEIFGPVLSTITFRTAEEAVKIANASTTACPARSGRRISAGPTRSRARFAAAASRSTPTTTMLTTSPSRSAATSSRGSGATSRCTRSTSTRSSRRHG